MIPTGYTHSQRRSCTHMIHFGLWQLSRTCTDASSRRFKHLLRWGWYRHCALTKETCTQVGLVRPSTIVFKRIIWLFHLPTEILLSSSLSFVKLVLSNTTFHKNLACNFHIMSWIMLSNASESPSERLRWNRPGCVYLHPPAWQWYRQAAPELGRGGRMSH